MHDDFNPRKKSQRITTEEIIVILLVGSSDRLNDAFVMSVTLLLQTESQLLK